MARIRIKFTKSYQGIEKGAERNFPAPISRILVRKGYATALDQKEEKQDENSMLRKKRKNGK